MVTVLIRAFIIYTLLLVALRLTGKRQVGELQISELITTFMISELAASPIQDLSIPIIYSIIPIIFLLCAEIILSFLATKSKILKKLFFGNPSMIIRKGKLDQKELGRLRIGINDFLGELRLKDAGDINDVEYAILEENGKLSVFLKEKEGCGLTHAIIVDGDINETNLRYANKDKRWLEGYLKNNKLYLEQIFLMTVNDQNEINIIKKEEK
ncbi:MAG: DUF421 domain-containing protein [Ruminococcaceae bacterium]|nr:DUF421 domain-containing protein [Oscillospiraceae bacterium]